MSYLTSVVLNLCRSNDDRDSENLGEEDTAIEDFEDGIVVGGKIVRDVNLQMIKLWFQVQKEDCKI